MKLPVGEEKKERPCTSKDVVLKRNGELAIFDEKGRELDRFKVPYGAIYAG